MKLNPLPPRKCPVCDGDLEYVKVSRKHHCPNCSTEKVYVIWTNEYLDGFEAGVKAEKERNQK